jgi:hypothetical protein
MGFFPGARRNSNETQFQQEESYFMKTLVVTMLLVAGLALTGCGSNHNTPGNINGNWTASLTDAGNNPVFGFSTSLAVNGDGSLVVTNFQFASNSSCFVSEETETGSFILSGNFNGNVTGQFQFTVTSGNPSGNTLTLNGTVNGNKITGTWQLVGGINCTDNGNFTITKM